MKKIFTCIDNYEAIKLSSFIFVKQQKETLIEKILNIIDNEIILSLKDKSAHSIIMNNKEQAELFIDFIQSVIEKEHKIINVKNIENTLEISKQ